MACWEYSRCADCKGDRRQVMPDGEARRYRFALIGEGPGGWEDREGVPFVGPSGQELDQTYLRLAGIDRSDVFVTNAVQCRQERAGQDVPPSAGLIACCADNHLIEELACVEPEIVLLCGASACRAIERYTDVRIDLELQHGFPVRADVLGRQVWLVPMLHPARGMHESRDMILLLQDWERLGLWLRGKWSPPTPLLHDRTKYRLIRSDFFKAVEGLPEIYEHLPVDTESDERKPWSLQFAVTPGVGYMILREDQTVVEDFMTWVAWSYDYKIVLHNAPHDLDDLPDAPWKTRDTMQEIYHLAGVLPQGLKAAVYRVFGHRMTSYDDVVTPHSKRALSVWLAEAMAHVTGGRQIIPHPIGPDCPTCGKRHRTVQTIERPHEAEAVLRRIMGKLGEQGSEYNPWEPPKWQKGEMKTRLVGRPWLEDVERKVGRMPRQSIVHAPLEEAVRYGCSDADWTGRLATWLEQERKRIVEAEWQVQ